MRPVFFCLVLLFFASAPAMAQHDGKTGADPADTASIPDQPRPLEITAKIKTELKNPLLGRTACDEDGNIYLRPYISQRLSGLPSSTSPVQKVKPDGTLAELFQNSDADGTKLATNGVSVSADGKLYQAGWTRDGIIYVTSFAKDGSVKSRTRIQGDLFHPYQLAVFKSGEFLLSGTKAKDGHASFTAVFSSDGQMLKEVSEPEDQDITKKAESGEAYVSANGATFANSAVEFGDAVSGSDGNVYLMRATSPAQIYVVSPHGEVVRKLRIDPGRSGYVAHTIRAAKDGVAVAFGIPWEKTDTVIKMISYSGDPIATYESTGNALNPMLFACFDHGSFTFLATANDNSVYLQIAESK